MGRFDTWRQRVRAMKRDTLALYVASRDPRVPWYSKALALSVVGYLLSPIDLIPDFIPVLGMVDDLIIVPAGVWLALKLIPPNIMDDCRAQASTLMEANPRVGRIAAFIIIGLWLFLLLLSILFIVRIATK